MNSDLEEDLDVDSPYFHQKCAFRSKLIDEDEEEDIWESEMP